MSVYWRGALTDERTADMMDEVVRIVGPDVARYIRPTQGSWAGGGVQASAGTHDGCGALDLAGQDAGMNDGTRNAIRDAQRQVGFASWVRTPDQSDWPYHIHCEAVQPGGKWDQGCLSSGAHGQVIDYFEGRNGLASGAADDGPRQWVGVTWETYAGGDEFDMASIQDLYTAVAETLRSEGVSGAGDAEHMLNRGYRQANYTAVGETLRSEGVSGAADPAHNGTNDILAAIAELSAKVDALEQR